MAQSAVPLPPGFDSLSVGEKIEYVHALWDSIVGSDGDVPVPDWHRELVRVRLREHLADPSAGRSWEESRADLQSKYSPTR